MFELVAAPMTTVLIVDDEAIIRLDLATELEEHGFAIIEAPNAEDGLALFRKHPATLAAVIDINLPGQMDGYGLVWAIRAERPNALVVIMSGSDFAPPATFDEHVIIERKPCDARKIAHILRSRIDRAGMELGTLEPKPGPGDQMPSA